MRDWPRWSASGRGSPSIHGGDGGSRGGRRSAGSEVTPLAEEVSSTTTSRHHHPVPVPIYATVSPDLCYARQGRQYTIRFYQANTGSSVPALPLPLPLPLPLSSLPLAFRQGNRAPRPAASPRFSRASPRRRGKLPGAGREASLRGGGRREDQGRECSVRG